MTGLEFATETDGLSFQASRVDHIDVRNVSDCNGQLGFYPDIVIPLPTGGHYCTTHARNKVLLVWVDVLANSGSETGAQR